jgi:hypothetical protein
MYVQSAAPPDQPKPKLLLLEHDKRFAVFPEFVYYDFAEPLNLPSLLPLSHHVTSRRIV